MYHILNPFKFFLSFLSLSMKYDYDYDEGKEMKGYDRPLMILYQISQLSPKSATVKMVSSTMGGSAAQNFYLVSQC